MHESSEKVKDLDCQVSRLKNQGVEAKKSSPHHPSPEDRFHQAVGPWQT